VGKFKNLEATTLIQSPSPEGRSPKCPIPVMNVVCYEWSVSKRNLLKQLQQLLSTTVERFFDR